MKKISFKSGFTLIELLVVIAIIGILTAIISANLFTAKAKARDARRISDIAQIQLALELVFDRCGTFPGTGILTSSTAVCTGTLGYYISTVPTDPTNPYLYVSNGTDYVLQAKLENYNDALDDDSDSAQVTATGLPQPTGGCDDTAPNYYYCVQAK